VLPPGGEGLAPARSSELATAASLDSTVQPHSHAHAHPNPDPDRSPLTDDATNRGAAMGGRAFALA
jgi:hypothetical protein